MAARDLATTPAARLGIRLAGGVVLGALSQLGLAVTLPVVPADLSAASAYLAGLLFGPLGALGVVLGHVATYALARGQLLAPLAALAPLLAALTAWLAFRRVPRASRSFHNVTSYQTFLLSAAGAALLYSIPLTAHLFGGFGERAILTWSASALTAIVLVVPPLSVVLHALGGRWLAPSGEEWAADRARARDGAVPWRVLVASALMVAALSVGFRLLQRSTPEAFPWPGALLFVPLLWAVARDGSRGGIFIGSLAGLGYLVATTGSPGAEQWHLAVLSSQGSAVFFAALAFTLGRFRDRERLLTEHLEGANLRLRAHLSTVVQALGSAIGAKDAYTQGHMRRVCTFAVTTGRRLGMGIEDLSTLEAAAMLHDVGKIGIPLSILQKPGPLTDEERAVVQRHPEIGARICEDIDELRAAADIIRHHQERWDGRTDGTFPGYPDGLSGEAIPLASRIVAVVDAFDAMTSTRSYRPAMPTETAVTELTALRGSQFDPRVVDAFLAALEENGWE